MAGSKISALTEATTITIDDVLPIVSGGVSKKVKVSTLNSATRLVVTEKEQYYYREWIANSGINTSTGAKTTDTTKDSSDYIKVPGSKSLTISMRDGSLFTCYGWTYDISLTPISEIRSNTLIGTQVSTYTFTTPANAQYINIYVRDGSTQYRKRIKIEATNAITYFSPVRPEDFTSFSTDSDKINAALDFARATSSPVVLTGNYTVTNPIVLHSNNTLTSLGARLKLSSTSYNNIIINEAVAGNTIFARGNKNIKILGSIILEGAENTWGFNNRLGVTQAWKMIALFFANVEDFQVKGISFLKTNFWAYCHEQCRYGQISGIYIAQNGQTPNQDGINIRRGSHHITISDVSGETYDDMIACTNLSHLYGDSFDQSVNRLGSTIYEPGVTALDIHHITMSNINRKSDYEFPGYTPKLYGSGILLLCEDGLKIYDIVIESITGFMNIVVGYTGIVYYVANPATVGDMYRIVIQNTNDAAVYIYRPLLDSDINNIAQKDRTGTQICALLPAGSNNVRRKYYGTPQTYLYNGYSNIKSITIPATTAIPTSTANPTQLEFGSGASGTAGSFSVWVKINNNSGRLDYLFSIVGTNNDSPGWWFGMQDNRVQYLLSSSLSAFTSYFTSTQYTNGSTLQFVYTWTGGNTPADNKIYVNGALATTQLAASGGTYSGKLAYDSTTRLRLGGRYTPTGVGTGTLQGSDGLVFDNPYFYNKALSASEVTELYNGGKNVDMSNVSFVNNIIEGWTFEKSDLSSEKGVITLTTNTSPTYQAPII